MIFGQKHTKKYCTVTTHERVGYAWYLKACLLFFMHVNPLLFVITFLGGINEVPIHCHQKVIVYLYLLQQE